MKPAHGLSPAQAIELRPVPSPCIDVCAMDEISGLCRGCRRTIDEIAGWSRLNDAGKVAVWRRIESRMHADFDDPGAPQGPST